MVALENNDQQLFQNSVTAIKQQLEKYVLNEKEHWSEQSATEILNNMEPFIKCVGTCKKQIPNFNSADYEALILQSVRQLINRAKISFEKQMKEVDLAAKE